MSLFKKILGKKGSKAPRGFEGLTVSKIDSVGNDTVRVAFDVPADLKNKFQFVPGQYIVLAVDVNGKNHRRSYSICSSPNEPLAIAAKKVDKGVVSTWLNETLKEGDEIFVSSPEGNFVIPEGSNNIVAIAAGSGITPIMSMIKSVTSNSFRLYYGNRTFGDILFKEEIDANKSTTPTYFLSGESNDACINGRVNGESFAAIIKDDLSILKSDAFMLCGPEEMIQEISEQLKTFGVSPDKIHFELFTTPTAKASEPTSNENAFKGKCSAKVILEGEAEEFEMSSKDFILERAVDEGLDVPYSCKGGVCSTCKAKVTEGSATMKINYSLSDKDIEEGYILTCQATPTSEEITVNYDL